jgi:hypothetical protein
MKTRLVFVAAINAACSAEGSPQRPLAPVLPGGSSATSHTGRGADASVIEAGGAGAGAADAGGAAAGSDLSCALGTLLRERCQSCHANPPAGAPMALVTRADLLAPARSNASLRVADLALTRMQRGEMPPAAPASAQEIALLSAWIGAGTPNESCATAQPTGDAGAGTNPFNTPTVCSSGDMWEEDDGEGEQMRPGRACISCHGMMNGPSLTIAGTVYPTAHEPDHCDGADDSDIAVVITGADGRVLELEVNSAGNFHSMQRVALPFSAKVVYDGRERRMGAMQMTGDCNSCHTLQGANGAPGRIMLP